MIILKLKPKLKCDVNCSLFKEIAIISGSEFNETECTIESTHGRIEVFRNIYFKYYGEAWESWRGFPKHIESDAVTEKGESLVEKGTRRVDVQPTTDENSWIFSTQPVIATDRKCPHCGSEEIEYQGISVGFGPTIPKSETMVGLYRCKNCGKSFQGRKGLIK